MHNAYGLPSGPNNPDLSQTDMHYGACKTFEGKV